MNFLLYTCVPLEEASSGQPPGDPLDRHHLTLLRDEALLSSQLNEGSLDTSLIEKLENLGIGGIADSSLALEFVGFNAISSGYAILALQVAKLRVVRKLEDLLGLALDDELAQLVICVRIETLLYFMNF